MYAAALGAAVKNDPGAGRIRWSEFADARFVVGPLKPPVNGLFGPSRPGGGWIQPWGGAARLACAPPARGFPAKGDPEAATSVGRCRRHLPYVLFVSKPHAIRGLTTSEIDEFRPERGS